MGACYVGSDLNLVVPRNPEFWLTRESVVGTEVPGKNCYCRGDLPKESVVVCATVACGQGRRRRSVGQCDNLLRTHCRRRLSGNGQHWRHGDLEESRIDERGETASVAREGSHVKAVIQITERRLNHLATRRT